MSRIAIKGLVVLLIFVWPGSVYPMYGQQAEHDPLFLHTAKHSNIGQWEDMGTRLSKRLQHVKIVQ